MLLSVIRWFEKRAFGVCSWWGERLGIAPTKIRMYFVYLSFFTVGSPVILYFVMAFILENKAFFKPRRKKPTRLWDY